MGNRFLITFFNVLQLSLLRGEIICYIAAFLDASVCRSSPLRSFSLDILLFVDSCDLAFPKMVEKYFRIW